MTSLSKSSSNKPRKTYLSRAEDICQEIDSIIEAHRVSTATTCEALATRADALADLALGDAGLLEAATRATVLTSLYADMQLKIERVMDNPEQIEALMASLETQDDDDCKRCTGGHG